MRTANPRSLEHMKAVHAAAMQPRDHYTPLRKQRCGNDFLAAHAAQSQLLNG